ncbi:dot2 [Cyberlindnera jadinii]|nr:dot2 [Cyberlindnera jadinii]
MKRHGLSAFDNNSQQFTELGQSLIRRKSKELSTQLQLFKQILMNFLDEHNDELTEDLQLRNEFVKTCSLVGIDPLKIYGKHTKMNEFYYELCCRIIEYCNSTRDINGGMIKVSQLLAQLKESGVVKEDIHRCVSMMQMLNEELQIVTIGHHEYLKNVHIGLTKDQTMVFDIVNQIGSITSRMLCDNLQWDYIKCEQLLQSMVSDGYLWVDVYKGKVHYWDPSWSV